jgi:RNA:NAD 2'-phosphotransferase (TPT1/KptA family)
VADSDKQRFSLRTHPVSGKLQIKANQGHSIKASNCILSAVTKVACETYYMCSCRFHAHVWQFIQGHRKRKNGI